MKENMEHLFSENESLSQDKLSELSDYCNLHIQLQKDIEDLEEKLKKRKYELEQVSRSNIPELLNSVGLSELRLSNGLKIIVEDKLKANIANKNSLVAYRNMIKAEGGDYEAERTVDELFKSQAVIEDATDKLLEYLIDKEIPYDMKRTIHYQTLAKYCRNRLAQGKEIPEGISVFQYQETKIKM